MSLAFWYLLTFVVLAKAFYVGLPWIDRAFPGPGRHTAAAIAREAAVIEAPRPVPTPTVQEIPA